MSNSLTGKYLVAMPGMGDPRFAHSVIVMCEHDGQRAMGVVVNKPKEDVTLSHVLEQLGLEAGERVAGRPVLDGGPVRPDRGIVLHSGDYSSGAATSVVSPGLALTTTREVLEAVAGEKAPADFVLALGYAGWGAGQLENELRHNVWMVVDLDQKIVFDGDHAGKWDRAIRTLGFDQLSSAAGSA
jgi:putative transcriptional regulator